MNVFHLWQLLLVTLASWINRQQHDVIAYIQEENRILKSKLWGTHLAAGLLVASLAACCPTAFYEFTAADPAVELPSDEASHCSAGGE